MRDGVLCQARQTGMKQGDRVKSVWRGGHPWYQSVPGSPDQVQVVLSQVAGPETVLRAATHGLVLGALREDGPLPRELEKLRNQVRAGKCLTAYTVDDLKWGGERMLGLRTRELLVLPPIQVLTNRAGSSSRRPTKRWTSYSQSS